MCFESISYWRTRWVKDLIIYWPFLHITDLTMHRVIRCYLNVNMRIDRKNLRWIGRSRRKSRVIGIRLKTNVPCYESFDLRLVFGFDKKRIQITLSFVSPKYSRLSDILAKHVCLKTILFMIEKNNLFFFLHIHFCTFLLTISIVTSNVAVVLSRIETKAGDV